MSINIIWFAISFCAVSDVWKYTHYAFSLLDIYHIMYMFVVRIHIFETATVTLHIYSLLKYMRMFIVYLLLTPLHPLTSPCLSSFSLESSCFGF